MAKAELKTKLNEASVEDFLNAVGDEQQRLDGLRILEIFKKATGEEPKMWGPSIIGFGHRVLKYDSGRELDWMITGFSPRKGTFALYSLTGTEKADELMAKLGKHKTGKGCLYIKELSDIDETVLAELISASVEHVRKRD